MTCAINSPATKLTRSEPALFDEGALSRNCHKVLFPDPDFSTLISFVSILRNGHSAICEAAAVSRIWMEREYALGSKPKSRTG